MIEIQLILKQLLAGQPLSESQAEGVFDSILTGALDPAQIAGVLSLISARPGGPTTDELVGGARVMRRHVTTVPVPDSGARGVLIDTCGTGGAPKAFNISTVSAIVTAAAAPGRVMVAKHGSVSRTGRGSAEVLGALGVNTSAPPEVQSKCLAEIGVCFCFSTHHHPAMRHAAPIRKSLGFPTIFNLLGPLINPASAKRQLIGTYNADVALKMAQTLARLGTERAWVVTSHDGLDELSTTSTNIAYEVDGAGIRSHTVDPVALGLPRVGLADLQTHTLEDAKNLFRDVLSGIPGPARDIVLLNTSAALLVAGFVASLAEGIEAARTAIDTGRATQTLDSLVRLSNAG